MVKRDFIKQLILAALLLLGLLVLRLYAFEPLTIDSQMENRYLKKQDIVVVSKQSDLNYGDFVLYRIKGKKYVGRVIAMANDQVIYMDDVLYRNDVIVEETYLKSAPHQDYYTEDLTIATLTNDQTDIIPEGEYLILNDNRTNTKDSRHFGLISKKQIVGQLAFRLTPLNEFGFIQTGITSEMEESPQ